MSEMNTCGTKSSDSLRPVVNSLVKDEVKGKRAVENTAWDTASKLNCQMKKELDKCKKVQL